jgi:DNA-binding NtrC family response regulator
VRLGGVLVELRVGLPPDDVRAALRREGLVYASSEMAEVAARVGRLAPFSSSVLVEGETGTGKEVVAQAIHRMSLRNHGPFVVVDCGAVSPSILESELFGHERGAFTGAKKRRPGAFERAHGGTLFLDEIGELPLHHQPSLLGVLQRRAFRRVGGSEDVQVDVRVLAATNRTLSVEVEEGRFRRDLFFRLSTLTLRLPPLRERLDDLEPLVAHFLADLTGAEPPALSSSILAELRSHRWTGNVRELRAIVERALVHGSWDLGDGAGPIATPPSETTSSFAPGPPLEPVPPATPSQLHSAVTYAEAKSRAASAFERSYLEELIRRCRGNASEASRIARLDRPHLLRLLRKHGLR